MVIALIQLQQPGRDLRWEQRLNGQGVSLKARLYIQEEFAARYMEHWAEWYSKRLILPCITFVIALVFLAIAVWLGPAPSVPADPVVPSPADEIAPSDSAVADKTMPQSHFKGDCKQSTSVANGSAPDALLVRRDVPLALLSIAPSH